MKFPFLYLLIHFIHSKYSYLSTQFFGQYSKNIVVFTGKIVKTKCSDTQDIKINDTLFEYNIIYKKIFFVSYLS